MATNPAGVLDPMLRLMAQCAENKGNECRNLHILIHSSGKTLRVDVGTVLTKVTILSGKPRVETVHYPVLKLSAWSRQIFSSGGQMLLGGHSLNDEHGYRSMFRTFWERFEIVRPDLDIYHREGVDLSYCIPICLHGDEGRGKLRRPIMVISYQPVITYKGPRYSNSSGFLGLIYMFLLFEAAVCCYGVVCVIFMGF